MHMSLHMSIHMSIHMSTPTSLHMPRRVTTHMSTHMSTHMTVAIQIFESTKCEAGIPEHWSFRDILKHRHEAEEIAAKVLMFFSSRIRFKL